MTKDIVKFNDPYLVGNELLNIQELCTENGPFYGAGRFTAAARALIADRIGEDKIVLTDSCTSALDVIGLILAHKTNKSTVICPSYTFSSTASAFIKAGFKVHFVDVNPDTLMIDECCLQNIDFNDVAALIVVHYAGQVCDLISLKNFCDDKNIYLIEDSAQAFGCELEGRHAGTFGDFGAFSFHETKNIHCGLGGALVVKDETDYQLAQYICDRGSNRSDLLKGLVDKYTWVSIGGSYTLSELAAAFLTAQLDQYTEFLKSRKLLWMRYYEKLIGQTGLTVQKIQPNVLSNFHAFYVIFESEKICDFVRGNLLSCGIYAYIGYVPLHSSPFAIKSKSCLIEPLPHTEDVSKRILRLPLHHKITIGEVDRICQIITN